MSPPRRPRLPRAAAWLLALLLLQAQALGLWHHIAHAGDPGVAAVAGAAAHAFGHDATDEAQCRLYDAVGQAAAAADEATPLAQALPQAAPAAAQHTPAATRLAQAYQARAPPA